MRHLILAEHMFRCRYQLLQKLGALMHDLLELDAWNWTFRRSILCWPQIRVWLIEEMRTKRIDTSAPLEAQWKESVNDFIKLLLIRSPRCGPRDHCKCGSYLRDRIKRIRNSPGLHPLPDSCKRRFERMAQSADALLLPWPLTESLRV